jgi:hypothetical protein
LLDATQSAKNARDLQVMRKLSRKKKKKKNDEEPTKASSTTIPQRIDRPMVTSEFVRLMTVPSCTFRSAPPKTHKKKKKKQNKTKEKKKKKTKKNKSTAYSEWHFALWSGPLDSSLPPFNRLRKKKKNKQTKQQTNGSLSPKRGGGGGGDGSSAPRFLLLLALLGASPFIFLYENRNNHNKARAKAKDPTRKDKRVNTHPNAKKNLPISTEVCLGAVAQNVKRQPIVQLSV